MKTALKITNIFWKRTYLFVEYEAENDNSLYIMNGSKVFYLEHKEIGKNKYRAKFNICITENGTMLPQGNWKIGTDICSLEYSDQILYELESFSRVFKYDNDKAYLVTFYLSETETNREVLGFNTEFMKTNRHPKRRFDSLYMIKKLMNLYYRFMRLFKSKIKKRVLFLSENKEVIGGNLKAIHDRIVERQLHNDFYISYSFENIIVKKSSVVYWMKLIAKIAKSDYIFVEDYVPVFTFLNISKKTKLIQTWHAGFGFKSVGYGRFGLSGSPNPFHSCHREYTYALVGNEELREVYTEVFGITKKSLLATGMPRLDNFLDKEQMSSSIAEFYGQYPQLKGKNLILFAPTYRGENQKEAYYDFASIDQDALYKYCKETDSVVMFKFHYFVTDSFTLNKEYRDCLIDFSNREDLHRLFYVADLLITDYSSCFYDYILLEKPVIFYLPDEAKFSATRGVHRTVHKTVPGKVVRSFEEMIETIKQKEYELYKPEDVPSFLLDKCKRNGEYRASDKVIDYILLEKEVDDICLK